MFKKFKGVIQEQITQGATSHGLALSCAFGVALGCFPLFGFSTFLCLAVGTYFRLNHPILQIVNYLMTPIHLVMIPVFLRVGEFLVGAEPIPLMPQAIAQDFFADPMSFLQKYGKAGMMAVGAWCLLSPFIGLGIYYTARPLFRRIQNRSGVRR